MELPHADWPTQARWCIAAALTAPTRDWGHRLYSTSHASNFPPVAWAESLVSRRKRPICVWKNRGCLGTPPRRGRPASSAVR